MSIPPLTHTCPRCAALLDVSDLDPFSEVTCPSCGAEMRVRSVFNQFEILEPIASGGMGTVYRARDTNLNRIVALKLIRREFSVDAEYIQKLEVEATVTASVSHPHVVKVFSFGCDQGLYYIAMELVDKGSLDDLMTLQGRVAEAQVLEIGIQAAEGLRAAYQAGLIHRDVKPGNILFADAHTSKIVDFGLALPLEQAQEASEDIWGTPYYVAPEKLNHEPEDFRSDIYSLGGTLFHALAGRPPFEADNASLVALKHLKNQPVSLQTFAPDISSPTAYVINRMLAKNPDDRYQSYDELIEHLSYARTKLLEHVGKAAIHKERVVVEGEAQQRVMGYIYLGAIAVVLGIGAVVFFNWESITARMQTSSEHQRSLQLKAASTIEGQYVSARKSLLNGDPAFAVAVLSQLNTQRNLPAHLKGWVPFLEGTAAYTAGFTTFGKECFKQLGQVTRTNTVGFADQKAASFFKEVSWQLDQPQAIHESILADYHTGDFGPLALYVFALREWSQGRFPQAVKIFEQFLDSQPGEGWDWLNQLKPIAQEYISDYQTAGGVIESINKMSTPAQRTEALPELEGVLKKLERLGRLRVQVLTLLGTIYRGSAGVVRYGTLKEQVFLKLASLNLAEAEKLVKEAKVAPFEQEELKGLSDAVATVKSFASMLVADLKQHPYIGEEFALRQGGEKRGKFMKATDGGIVIESNGKEEMIAWSALAPATVVSLGEATLQALVVANAKGLPEREWALGTYLSVINREKEATALLLKAAAQNPEKAKRLSWYPAFR